MPTPSDQLNNFLKMSDEQLMDKYGENIQDNSNNLYAKIVFEYRLRQSIIKLTDEISSSNKKVEQYNNQLFYLTSIMAIIALMQLWKSF